MDQVGEKSKGGRPRDPVWSEFEIVNDPQKKRLCACIWCRQEMKSEPKRMLLHLTNKCVGIDFETKQKYLARTGDVRPRHAKDDTVLANRITKLAAPACRKIVIAGGNFNTAFIHYMATLTGKPRPRVCFLPTAAADRDTAIIKFYDNCSTLDVEPYVQLSFVNSSKHHQSFDEVLLSMDAIVCSGGNTLNQQAIWRAQGIDIVLRQAWERGIVLGGASAGSLCWFEEGASDSRPKELSVVKCLGFLQGSHCPHYSEPDRRTFYHKLVYSGDMKAGYACDNDAGIYFEDFTVKHIVSARADAKVYYVSLSDGKLSELEIPTTHYINLRSSLTSPRLSMNAQLERQQRPTLDAESFGDDLWCNFFDESGEAATTAQGSDAQASTTPHGWSDSVLSDESLALGDHDANMLPARLDEFDTKAISMASDNSSHNHFPAQFGPSIQYPLVAIPIASAALSKPLCRYDGLLLVGTEQVQEPGQNYPPDQNRIFTTNFRAVNAAASTSSVPVPGVVRDMQWMNPTLVVLAVGKDIQFLHIALNAGSEFCACHLQEPISIAHSDTIREIAVPQGGHEGTILSGGFDETVCLTDVENHDVVMKFDARNVVSSVRWTPEANHVSWTTDGGNVSIADTRIRSATGQINFETPTYLRFDHTGGLFTHDYFSMHSIVLGYESGLLAFLDIRKPGMQSCYMTCKSPLESIGEVRKSTSNDFAIFGAGGFSLLDLHDADANSDKMGIGFAPKLMEACKTSGDFALGNNNLMAVSDSLGIVSVYDTQHLRRDHTMSF
ncbi:hypothetical protein LEN26_020252 [Aphanomyces euteiches]|nr:hypothetical protein LEN26_020252 [Aphanomyces euteiches]KAH9101761.1 hypothetical protein AeMF1_021466 [Aphanomyces euteiches]KAH9195343.1 hypothetical protein AeNC1_002676 [Aphanomyces euteiches]